MSQSIFSNIQKKLSKKNVLQFVVTEWIRDTSQNYNSWKWPLVGCGGGLYICHDMFFWNDWFKQFKNFKWLIQKLALYSQSSSWCGWMVAGAWASVWCQCGREVGECGNSGTSLAMEFGTNILLKKFQKLLFINHLLVHFKKSVTGSKSMCRSVMASSFQRWS